MLHPHTDPSSSLTSTTEVSVPSGTEECADFLKLARETCSAHFAGILLAQSPLHWWASDADLDGIPDPVFWALKGSEGPIFETHDRRTDAAAAPSGADDHSFAGVLLKAADGSIAGLLCIARGKRDALSTAEREMLLRLGRLISSHLTMALAAQQQSEAAAAQQHTTDRLKLLETCLDRLNDIVMITEAEPQKLPGHRILYVNSAFEKMTGYSREEIVGESPRKLKGPGTDPVESARIRESLKRWETIHAEVLNYKKNGEAFWNEMSISPVADATGWFTNWISIERDVTERRKAQDLMAANMKSLAELKAALDESSIVAITDPQGKITYANDKFCAISKYSREELIGQDHRIINSGFHPTEFIAELWETIRSGRVWKGQIKNRAKDRSFYWVDTTIVPFLGPDEKPVQYIAIRSDISLQMALANELEQTNRELSDFAYVVSHDLKAPLRGIGTLAEWLVEDYAHLVDDDGREQFALLTTRVKRLDSLINGILSYSRAGRSREQRVSVDMDSLCRNVADMLAPPASVRIEIETVLPTVLMEPTKAQQLIQNLLSNAIKFSDKEDSLIRVRCDEDDGEWHFQVADNGTGIEEKYFVKIFELFETLAPRDEVEGTGVGLALVKKIVETAGGRIWVESQRGTGSTFHFTLPQIGSPIESATNP